ncbi:hypothetical protein QYM36_008795 [Artemia franciscana]|uniref:Uncharacterized protein n=1 Tax=Artemia franciscana TaxID=6661 RepID=A0AA88HY35_ARTSF|nr:hypothetical protein QYM36_008795 [Artemia franciscana]
MGMMFKECMKIKECKDMEKIDLQESMLEYFELEEENQFQVNDVYNENDDKMTPQQRTKGIPTRINSRTGDSTTIDLIMANPKISCSLVVDILHDLVRQSDYNPVIVEIGSNYPNGINERRDKFRTGNVSWDDLTAKLKDVNIRARVTLLYGKRKRDRIKKKLVRSDCNFGSGLHESRCL